MVGAILGAAPPKPDLAGCTTGGTNPADFICQIEKTANLMSFISIPLAIGSVVVLGLIVMGSMTTGRPRVAAGTLKRFALILVGLVVVFNAPTIARIVLI